MTTTETYTDKIALNKPFTLQIGDRRYQVERRGMLVNKRDHLLSDAEGHLPVPRLHPTPYQGVVTLSIDGEVVVIAHYRRGDPPVYELIRHNDETFTVRFDEDCSKVSEALTRLTVSSDS
jgi:hypothetical protein